MNFKVLRKVKKTKMNINQLNISQLGKAAVYYAAVYKWHVFPLIPNRKEPLIKNGLLGATLDVNQIIEWWSNNPNANVGIRTGKESGIVVIDVDGEIGEQSMKKLVEQYGPLPETVESVTGSGGRHILFKYPAIEGIQVKNKVGWLWENSKIDIRADGGYIVAPPSIHPNGNMYEWELSSRPNEVEMAEVPTWLLDLLIEKPKQQTTKHDFSHWESIMQGVNEGGRNVAAMSLAGHLLRRYVDPTIVYYFMHIWNEQNNPPLDEKELNTTLKSARKKELKRREEENFNLNIKGW